MPSQPIDWIEVCKIIPSGMMITTIQFTIQFMNEACLSLLGLDSVSRCKDKRLQDFCHLQPVCSSTESDLAETDHDSYELEFFDATKAGVSTLAYTFPVTLSQKNDALVWLIVNINHYKKTNELLQSRLVASETANSSKTFFLANISHGIRSHLNSIIGFYQLMNDKATDYSVPREIDQYMKGIEFSSEQLQLLVNSILDLTALEKGQLSVIQPSAFQVEQLMQSIFDLFKEKAAEKSLWFTFEIDDSAPNHIRADKRILAQILTNLVDNAIKFTNRGNAVHLKVSAAHQQVVFEVRDEGVGIDQQQISNLFHLHELTSAQGNDSDKGAGLGLTIVKRLTELIEGEISVASNKGEGATFTLQIPLYEVELIATKPDTLSKSANRFLKDNRILIIEDDKMNNEVYKAWFEDFAFEVMFAENGEIGLEMARSRNLDLIITDIHLPGIDGIETIERLRGLPHHQKTPIVVISASTFMDKRSLAFEAGCNDYFVKPINLKKILNILKKYLKGLPKDQQPEFIFPEFGPYLSRNTKSRLLEHYTALRESSPVHLEKIVERISEIKLIFNKLGHNGPSFLDRAEHAAFVDDEEQLKSIINQAIMHYFGQSGLSGLLR